MLYDRWLFCSALGSAMSICSEEDHNESRRRVTFYKGHTTYNETSRKVPMAWHWTCRPHGNFQVHSSSAATQVLLFWRSRTQSARKLHLCLFLNFSWQLDEKYGRRSAPKAGKMWTLLLKLELVHESDSWGRLNKYKIFLKRVLAS